MKKNLAPLLAGCLLVLASGQLLAEEATTTNAPEEQKQPPAPSYLGVVLGPVPPEVQAQLPKNTKPDQGLLVKNVMPGSPAEKADLQRHDVLLSIDGQALLRPEELIEAVRGAAPGSNIDLEVLRHGAVQKISVTLAAKERPRHRMPHPRYLGGPRPMLPPQPSLRDEINRPRVWESFQAMTVNKQPDGTYNASVEFLDEKGNRQKFEFQGSREEVIAQVKKEPDLPESQKQQLLNALQDRNTGFPSHMFHAFPDFEELERKFFTPPFWPRPERRSFWD